MNPLSMHAASVVVRWAALLELLVILFAAGLIASRYRSEISGAARAVVDVVAALGVVVFAVAVALTVNIGSVPPTPGSQVLAGLLLPVAVWMVTRVARVMRGGHR